MIAKKNIIIRTKIHGMVIMKGLIKNSVFYLIIGALILLYFIFPNSVSKSVGDSLVLCKNVVIPSLFFFFILSNLFIESGMCQSIGRVLSKILSPLFNLSGPACVAFILSLIAGYPAGGIGCVTLYKSGGISKAECERLLMFSNNCGPAFIITAVGASMLGSIKTGVILYIVHIFSAVSLGIITGRMSKKSESSAISGMKSAKKSPLILFTEAIKKSAAIMLDVCAIIVTFSAVTGLLTSCGIFEMLSDILKAANIPDIVSSSLPAAILELTYGASLICRENADTVMTAALLSGIIGFGGFCVHIQLSPYIHEAGLKSKKYFIGKTLHGVIIFIITFMIMKFLYKTGAVFAPSTFSASASDYLLSSVLLFFCAAGALMIAAIMILKRKR